MGEDKYRCDDPTEEELQDLEETIVQLKQQAAHDSEAYECRINKLEKQLAEAETNLSNVYAYSGKKHCDHVDELEAQQQWQKHIVKTDKFRSKPTVNMAEDMIRITLEMTLNDYRSPPGQEKT